MQTGDTPRDVRTWLARACLGTVLVAVHCAYGQQAEPPDAATPAAESVAVEVFQAPKVKKYSFPEYPISERLNNKEGWVELNFMVNPAGEAYEIAVTESSGNEAFERKALQALQRTQFTPATFEGKPVDASSTLKMTFLQNGIGSSSSGKFTRNFNTLMQAIEKGDKAAADAQLATLRGENLRELAYAGAAKYEYYAKWGSEAEQLEALTQAIASEKKPDYLPKALFNSMLQSKLRLQLLKQDFGTASATWTTLQENGADPKILASFKPIMDDVAKLRSDDRSFVIQAEIAAGRPSWFTQLHKKKFQVGVSSGKIVEVKLRCDKKYVFFPFDPQLEYRIGDQYGTCFLELVGDPATKFKLRQS